MLQNYLQNYQVKYTKIRTVIALPTVKFVCGILKTQSTKWRVNLQAHQYTDINIDM